MFQREEWTTLTVWTGMEGATTQDDRRWMSIDLLMLFDLRWGSPESGKPVLAEEVNMRRSRGLNVILGALAGVFGTALLVPVFC